MAWADEFGVARDVSALGAEKNVLRYLPVPVTIRHEDARTDELLRVVAAGVAAGSAVTVSAATPLAPKVADLVTWVEATYVVADPAAWARMLRSTSAPRRVRLLGGERKAFADSSTGRADIALHAQPVVEAGRVELPTFLREQAVATTAHRFGSPAPAAEGPFAGT
jgi:RHH-type transcriptional regulator, proline utilization regulon repressor / proline dehydrogenase / delta 1-pyrroline-5-carboxylate dehydrogenase